MKNLSVYWLKLNANFDNDERVVWLEGQRGGEAAAYYYVKLNCIAARCNQEGGIYVAEGLPHNAKTLANKWNCKEVKVKKSLDLLVEAKLLEIYDGVYFIADWCELQSTAKLDEIREYERLRKQKFRERQKASAKGLSEDLSRTCPECPDTDIDKETEIEKEIDIDGGDIE